MKKPVKWSIPLDVWLRKSNEPLTRERFGQGGAAPASIAVDRLLAFYATCPDVDVFVGSREQQLDHNCMHVGTPTNDNKNVYVSYHARIAAMIWATTAFE